MKWQYSCVAGVVLIACLSAWAQNAPERNVLPFTDHFDTETAGHAPRGWRPVNKFSEAVIASDRSRSAPAALQFRSPQKTAESIGVINQTPFINPASNWAPQRIMVSLALLAPGDAPEVSVSILSTSFGAIAGTVRITGNGDVEFAHGADGKFAKIAQLSRQELGEWIQIGFRVDSAPSDTEAPEVREAAALYELSLNGRGLGVRPLKTKDQITTFNQVRILSAKGRSVYLDDIEVTVPGAKSAAPATTAPASAATQERKFGDDFEKATSKGLDALVNIAGACSVRGHPFLPMAARRMLVDGDKTTRAPFTRGISIGGEIELKLPQPAPVSVIRLYQGVLDPRDKKAVAGFSAICDSYELQGRTPGSDKWNVKLAQVNGTAVGGWNRHDLVPPVTLEAVRFVATKGAGGYMTSYPVLGELEIYTGREHAPAPPPPAAAAAALEENWIDAPEAAALEKTESFDLHRRLMCGVTIEPWMFSWNTWEPEKGPLAEHPPLKQLVASLKEMRVNTIWLFPPDGHRVRGGSNPPSCSIRARSDTATRSTC